MTFHITNLRNCLIATAALAAALLGACDEGGADSAVDSPEVVAAALSAELDGQETTRKSRRQRIAAYAESKLEQLPPLPLNSEHPLDAAISDSLDLTANTLQLMSAAEYVTRAELREGVKDFVVGVQEDASDIAVAIDAINDGVLSDAQVAVDVSCSKRCLDEWKLCLEEFEVDDPSDPGDWAGSLMCAVTLEICFADCLLPG